MSENILGLSAYYHDSAAALLKDGEIIAAAQEERFTRKKHDFQFPAQAAAYVMNEGDVKLDDLAAVVFYDNPYLKFRRLLGTYLGFAPKGLMSFLAAMPGWCKEKLFMRKMLRHELTKLGKGCPNLLFSEHHLSHAASAFFPSPFEFAAILTIDGVGEWATTTIGLGEGKNITILNELHFPHSLGLLYSAFTSYCGFKVNSGEYKMMGLAPYGNPDSDQCKTFKKIITAELVDIRDDGSFLLNMDYFDYATGLTMCREDRWESLFGITKREAEAEFTQDYMNLALAIQQITEGIVLKLAGTAKNLTGCENLVMAGGVALNCVANGKLLKSDIFKEIWVQPASGDAGGALGAAMTAWHIWRDQDRQASNKRDYMQGCYLGPAFSEADTLEMINKYGSPYSRYENFDKLCEKAAELIAQGHVIGWFQNRMEYGPRALGNRSILGDARHPQMQKKLNLKIKYREGFRPFAPSVLQEEIGEFFELDRKSAYMLLVAPVKKERRKSVADGYEEMRMYERLYDLRSDIPAVTHVDYSARIQSVSKETNYRYWKLIETFREKTGYGVLVNTSFNVRGEPIVCTPEDAYLCFMRTEMDYLVMDNLLFEKQKQPPWNEEHHGGKLFELD